jgi:thiamine biosynthesis lipoprotein
VTRFLLSKILALLAGILLVIVAYNHNSNSLYLINGNAYGTSWTISSSEYISDHHKEKIEIIINKIDYVASNYKEDSEIALINKNFKEYQFISNDLFNILAIAKDVELKSEGFYNIMLGKISSNLGFSPTFNQNLIQKKISTFDLDEKNNSLIRKNNNWFDLSSLIDIGGEIIINGFNKGKPWSVGIQDPYSFNDNSNYIIQNKDGKFMAIATSGEYRNFKLDSNGNKVTHTINPKTLKSIDNNILSVTVVHEYSSTYADAYATSFNAMGSDNAIRIANENNIAIMIMTLDGDEEINLYSDKWYDLNI